MRLTDLPDDALLHVMHCLQSSLLGFSCKQLHRVWTTHCLCLPVSPSTSVQQALWVSLHVDRNSGGVLLPTVGGAWLTPHTVVACGGERLRRGAPPRLPTVGPTGGRSVLPLCRAVRSLAGLHLRRLCLRKEAGAVFLSDDILVNLSQVLAGTCQQLRTLEIHLPEADVSDLAFGTVGVCAGGLRALTRLSVRVPLNRITLAGLQRFVSGLLSPGVRNHPRGGLERLGWVAAGESGLRELDLDVCGNWIRGDPYGSVLSRVGELPQVRRLALAFGGWGVRKKFGLEALAALQVAKRLQSLSLTVVGARITCEFFRKAMGGIVLLPGLRRLSLDLARTFFCRGQKERPRGADVNWGSSVTGGSPCCGPHHLSERGEAVLWWSGPAISTSILHWEHPTNGCSTSPWEPSGSWQADWRPFRCRWICVCYPWSRRQRWCPPPTLLPPRRHTSTR